MRPASRLALSTIRRRRRARLGPAKTSVSRTREQHAALDDRGDERRCRFVRAVQRLAAVPAGRLCAGAPIRAALVAGVGVHPSVRELGHHGLVRLHGRPSRPESTAPIRQVRPPSSLRSRCPPYPVSGVEWFAATTMRPVYGGPASAIACPGPVAYHRQSGRLTCCVTSTGAVQVAPCVRHCVGATPGGRRPGRTSPRRMRSSVAAPAARVVRSTTSPVRGSTHRTGIADGVVAAGADHLQAVPRSTRRRLTGAGPGRSDRRRPAPCVVLRRRRAGCRRGRPRRRGCGTCGSRATRRIDGDGSRTTAGPDGDGHQFR